MASRVPNSGFGPTPAPPLWTIVVYTVVGLLSAVLIYIGADRGSGELLLAGLIGVIGVLLLAPLVAAIRGSTGSAPIARLASMTAALERLAEEQTLSDDARRVLNRRRERDILCLAIEEDIAAQDWDAATILVKELAERFGYRAEAEEFRQRVDRTRSESIDRKVGDAVRNLDALIVRGQWDEAASEAARITRVYPDSPRVDGLRHRVERARERYKADIERRFLNAAKEGRVEEAHDLLKELDNYLTEVEAEPYRELARGVIGQARENLGVQFKLSVQDRDWRRAADVGERIIREFPNTRMAEEIRGVIDGVREKAATMAQA
ncbi:MAG: hypothetical protein H6810_09240 [Phycisphaeraceae bacterium]|nr:MAG: hypothetical protein H6810_09240 [Phycisphaeraceae bacterium]